MLVFVEFPSEDSIPWYLGGVQYFVKHRFFSEKTTEDKQPIKSKPYLISSYLINETTSYSSYRDK